ncbi:hypothetical protein J3F83DRAFT_732301 [Trichoderma novae-zelandiae]
MFMCHAEIGSVSKAVLYILHVFLGSTVCTKTYTWTYTTSSPRGYTTHLLIPKKHLPHSLHVQYNAIQIDTHDPICPKQSHLR